MYEPHNERKFSFTLSLFEDVQGEEEYQALVVNKGVPPEVIIARMHAFVVHLKKAYGVIADDNTTFLDF